MLYGRLSDGTLSLATRAVSAACPTCGAVLIPKLGRIVHHHWAHRSSDCDPWSEPETPWHVQWKTLVRPLFAEVPLRDAATWHRADMLGKAGVAVELQHSSINGDTVLSRCQFYNTATGGLCWIFDMTEAANRVRFSQVEGCKYRFTWSRSRPVHAVAMKSSRVFWDIGTSVLFNPTQSDDRCSTGFGYAVAKSRFLEHELGETLAHDRLLLSGATCESLSVPSGSAVHWPALSGAELAAATGRLRQYCRDFIAGVWKLDCTGARFVRQSVPANAAYMRHERARGGWNRAATAADRKFFDQPLD